MSTEVIYNSDPSKTKNIYISVESRGYNLEFRGYNLDQIYKKVSDKTFVLSFQNYFQSVIFFFTKWLRYLISVHKTKYHADLKNNNKRL